LPGGFVDMPRRDAGHFSRWEKSPTTFGPTGRLIGTGLVAGVIVFDFFLTFVVFWLIELFVGAWIVRELWKPGWVVPHEAIGARAEQGMPVIEAGFRVPVAEAPLPIQRPVIPTPTIVAWSVIGLMAVGVTLFAATGDHVRQGVIGIVASLMAIVLIVNWARKG
jgi:hypothetical protein